MNVVIGLIGRIGSGKGTFVEIFTEIVSSYSVLHVRTVKILAETCKLWKIEPTRKNLQDIPLVMEHFRPGPLTYALCEDIRTSKDDFIVYDCVRLQSDWDMIGSFPAHFYVYITADHRIRWERCKIRKEKMGEAYMSFEEFQENDRHPIEREIDRLGEMADFTIVNNGDMDRLRKDVERFASIHAKYKLEFERQKPS